MKVNSNEQLAEQLLSMIPGKGKRLLCALIGPPASGKSTLAEWLKNRINKDQGSVYADVISQDGFHYDDAVLLARDRLEYKGAPDTFDVAGLDSLLQRAATVGEIAIPVFDRKLEISRNAAHLIPESCRMVIVEGNYLLLESQPDWRALRLRFDISIMLQVERHELRRRLLERWKLFGYSDDIAERKTTLNDLPNADLVVTRSGQADILLHA